MVNQQKLITFLAALIFFTGWTFAQDTSDQQGEIFDIRRDVVIEEGTRVDAVYVIMGSAEVDGIVEEDVVSFLGNITVGPKGIIKGDAVAIGGKVISKRGSRVRGKKASIGVSLKNLEKTIFMAIPILAGAAALALGTVTIFTGIGFVVLIVLVLTLFEKRVHSVQRKMDQRPWFSLGLGVLGFCGLIPVLVFLMITIIGIPLAFLVAAVAMAALVLGMVGSSYWLGKIISERWEWTAKTLWSGLLGMLVLFLIGLIPVLGPMIQICFLFLGFGAVIQTRFK